MTRTKCGSQLKSGRGSFENTFRCKETEKSATVSNIWESAIRLRERYPAYRVAKAEKQQNKWQGQETQGWRHDGRGSSRRCQQLARKGALAVASIWACYEEDANGAEGGEASDSQRSNTSRLVPFQCDWCNKLASFTYTTQHGVSGWKGPSHLCLFGTVA